MKTQAKVLLVLSFHPLPLTLTIAIKRMKGYFHMSQLHTLDGGNVQFDITFIKDSGEIIKAKNAVMTSFWSKGLTMRIKYQGSAQPVKVRRSQVIEINGKELIV